jgi:hypothetical protein
MTPSGPALILSALLSALLLASPAPAHGMQSGQAIAAGEVDLPSLLAGLERQRAKAIVRRDIGTLRHLMDRQYYHIESSGRARSKTELLTALERSEFRFQVYEIETLQVQVLGGGGAALVTGTFRSLMAHAAAKPFRGRYARVWVHQPDGWKNTYHQTTAIRPAHEACHCD